jgi:hypothetical protein
MDTVSLSKTAGSPARAPGVPQIRIGDAERQEAARKLEQHYADGRLTWEELDERLARAYTARVQDELTPLFADLPALPPPPAPPPSVRSRAQDFASRVQRRDLRAILLWAFIAAAVVGALEWRFLPLVLIWTFVVLGHRGRHGHYHRRYGHHHGR